MRRGVFKTTVILAMATAFLLVTALAFAADTPKGKEWYVLKSKKNVCSVSAHKEKPKTAIAGPFASKDEAMKEKEKLCPKPPKKEAPKKEGNKKPPTP